MPLNIEAHQLPAQALLYLERAEPKQSFHFTRTAGSKVIEETSETHLIQPNAQCDPETNPGCEGGGGWGGGGTCTAYNLRQIATFDLYDNNNPFEGNEIEVTGTAGLDGGGIRLTGVTPNDDIRLNSRILCAYSSSNVKYSVTETDGWPNPSDNFSLPSPNTAMEFEIDSTLNLLAVYLWSWPNYLNPNSDPYKILVRVSW